MSAEKSEVRVLLRHYFKQKYTAAAAAKRICEIEGEELVNERTAQRWFKRFSSGNLRLEDKERPGRPVVWDIEKTKNTVESNPCTSTRQLSNTLGPSKSTVHRHLITLGKVNKCCRVVPHDLNEEQAQRRIEVCRQLLNFPKDDRFLRKIITCDEKWIYFHNPNMQRQWLDKCQLPKPVPKRERFEKKVLLCVWWNYEGLIYYELVPDGLTINSDTYCQQLEKVYEILKKKYPSMINRKAALLQQDNARPHTAKRTKEKIKELEAFELLPHPAFSPDLAPSDYYLFRSMAQFFRGRNFQSIEEVDTAVTEFFASKNKDWFYQAFRELADRWEKVIQHQGLYFEY